MPFMKAMQIAAPGAEFELVQKEIPEPKETEVRIKVEFCGICHGDAVVKEGRFPGISYSNAPPANAATLQTAKASCQPASPSTAVMRNT
jgi:NADPH:quinone reductase-like Zn-dependent oxidoreductase